MALAMSTAIMTGRMWVICPVSSNTMTEVEIVCVTAPAIAAAPTTVGRNNNYGGGWVGLANLQQRSHQD